MPKLKRPLKVFLCHAHADRDPVRGLYARLTQDGVDAWLDKAKLLPGQDWELEIRKAVREADVVVVCLSKQFNQAGFRQKEVRLALDTAMEQPEGDIFIIPARLEECDVLEILHRYHWVDLFDEGGYENLMKALKLRDEQLEKARIEKEEIKKRRLPYFETPIIQNSEPRQDNENSTNKIKKDREDNPLSQASMKQKLSLNKSKGKRLIKTEYIVAIIGAAATIIAGILGSPLIEKWLAPTSTITPISANLETTPAIVATPTVLPIYVWDLVLPCGHTPPDSQGNTRFNEDEIPKEYRYLLETLQEVSPPIAGPKQATRIQIPTISVDAPIVQGDGWEQLKKGVGQRIGSVNPGELGNIVLCAHNDIYGEIFRYLDQLNKGDEIIIYTQENKFTYLVTSVQPVDPTLVDVMLSFPKRTLTLISAYPYLVDNMRVVVKAELQSSIPNPNPKAIRIGIVSGRSGNDSGAVCLDGNGQVTLTEADINLTIAALVQQKLLDLGFDVDLMKEFDPRLNNYNASALISIHNDSCEYINDQATGFKVVSSINNSDSEKRLTSCLIEKYKSTTGLAFHLGSSTPDMTQYHVFSEVNSNTPVAIIETGFLNLDRNILTEQSDLVANGIVKGIVCFGFSNN